MLGVMINVNWKMYVSKDKKSEWVGWLKMYRKSDMYDSLFLCYILSPRWTYLKVGTSSRDQLEVYLCRASGVHRRVQVSSDNLKQQRLFQ